MSLPPIKKVETVTPQPLNYIPEEAYFSTPLGNLLAPNRASPFSEKRSPFASPRRRRELNRP